MPVIYFDSTDELSPRVVQKLNHNFRNIGISKNDARRISSNAVDDLSYENLKDKPKINNIILVGNFSAEDLGLCPIDENGIVPIDYLPGYVDDVIECTVNPDAVPYSYSWLLDEHGDIVIPETGKVYVVTIQDGSSIYRWSGSTYVQLSAVIDSYDQLSDKPSIENVMLIDDKSFNDLGIFRTDSQGYSVPDDYSLNTQEINDLWTNALPLGG